MVKMLSILPDPFYFHTPNSEPRPLKLSYETVKSEPQNIECRMSNVECRSVESLRSVIIKWTIFIYSTFDVGCSMFDVHQFLI